MNLTPKSKAVRAEKVKVGDVILESFDHPAVVVEIRGGSGGRTHLYCRYVWQSPTELMWKFGTFPPGARIPAAKKGEY